MLFLPFAGAIVGGLFVSADQSDGVVRMKVVSGVRRGHIYLSAFFTQSALLLALLALYHIVYLAMSLDRLREVLIPSFGVYLLLSALFLVLVAAVCTLLEMLIPHRAALIAALLVLLLIALLFSGVTMNRLMEPESILATQISRMTDDGPVTEAVMRPNPRYVPPEQRWPYELALDAVPLWNFAPISSIHVTHPARAAVFAVIDTLALTLLGLYLFTRKDLK